MNLSISSTDGADATPTSVQATHGDSKWSDAESIVELKNVTVKYRSYKERPSTLKETCLKFIKTGSFKSYSTFDALQDVSFDVKRGMILGIIGSNGSGKSTLLKILAQVLKPSAGSVVIRGSISSLMDLGIGFDMDLNAIENVYLHGSLYRRTKEQIDARLDAILEFAELKEFATTPIKYYSAGMVARLGFATAVDVNPDVLLVDEVLGVGDERFQVKCRGVFDRFLSEGKTIIMVTHAMDFVEQKADKAILLSKGRIAFTGSAKEAVALYRDKAYETRLG